ncbi:MAG: efflux RND transporter periplasmic adaptor subunit [Cyanobacteria bacterium J06626_14]
MVQIQQWQTSHLRFRPAKTWFISLVLILVAVVTATGCSEESSGDTGRSPESSGSTEDDSVVVDVAIAQATSTNSVTYTGTTEPVQTVLLRSQTEGQLLNLSVDVGDSVERGETLGRLDSDLLQTAVVDAEAELSAREFLVIQAEAAVADAEAQVELAIAELQQAQADAERFRSLADDGAIAEQLAEQAQTVVRTAEQAVRSAEQVVRNREQAIAAAERRVESQQAILAQTRERLAFATLTSPLTGTVLERFVDPGDLIQPGQEVLRLGDLSAVDVQVQIADRDRSQIQVGQPAEVQLDAFPAETFSGRVTRISPVADAAARLIPVDITLSNPSQRIGSGLIARVDFVAPVSQQTISVPESALALSSEEPSSDEPMIFVLSEASDSPIAQPRSVTVGDRRNGQVEILSGLEAGESYILRANQPLTPGQVIQPSLLSSP